MKEDILHKPISELKEKWKLIPQFLLARGVTRHHIESFDHFVNSEMPAIMNSSPEIRSDHDRNFFLQFTHIHIGKPTYEDNGITQDITPHECRMRDLTYSAPIYVNIKYTKGQQIISRTDVPIGRLPIMLKSDKCVLKGLSSQELADARECSMDPGGYFVVKGTEKVILMQEQLAKNRIIIETDPSGIPQGNVQSSTHLTKTQCNVIQKKGLIFMKQNTLGEDIPIVILLKAMGITSDQEIVAMIGSEQYIQERLAPTIQEAYRREIRTQKQALEYIGGMIKRYRRFGYPSSLTREDEARNVLSTVLLPHLPSSQSDFRLKAVFIANVVRNVILAEKDKSLLSDKDYYGNKRLDLAGVLMSLLFEDLFKRFQAEIKKLVDQNLSKANRASCFDAITCIRQDTITTGMINALATGNWVLKRFKMDKGGVTQQLDRLSYISFLGMLTRINSHFEKTRKVSGPRALQPSQWGMLCPSDTPEGEQCGLVKNLALLCDVTVDAEAGPVRRMAFDLGVDDARLLTGEELNHPSSFTVFLNGVLLGIHREPNQFAYRMRLLRRIGLIGRFTSVYVNHKHKTINLATDGGRVCRPLIIIDPKTHEPMVKQHHIDDVAAGKRSIHSLFSERLLEYVDVNEENNTFISVNEKGIKDYTTHMEIDPLTILGVVAGLIPYPHHNQSPRNTYQCAMGKQATGAIGENQYERFDTMLNLLVYPQKPMVRTRTLDMIGFDRLPAGQNAIIAVMSYSGYDIEDALVINKAALDRGYGRAMVMRSTAVQLKKYSNGTSDTIMGPPEKDQRGFSTRMQKNYNALEADGLPRVHGEVLPHQILVNKQSPIGDDVLNPGATGFKPTAVRFKGTIPARVDKVMITTNNRQEMLLKVVTRQLRRPELGDKFSSRHGQKGVCGIIVNQEDMPFNDLGMCPDMIMNPHGFPSRMTVGKMIELIGGKAGLMDGYRRYGTAFGGDSVESISSVLSTSGFNYAGKDTLTSGITGEPLETYIFFGPMYYQKLKHMVVDKMHARARGPRTTLTRQPTEGRARDGGLRLGEMERDCLIGYGASMLLVERLMISSDAFTAHVCQKCGLLGYDKWCQHCKCGDDIAQLRIPYACKLLFQELQSMNVVPRLKLSNM
eukprot:TRINITY_DN22719_c0_g1_i1.p1 TRINITY_DN22719_c0_g1~~TRINITY_DN22719_c0_g1_i1.p1  ORF type:complete len:1123 (+),score=348.94 TRINITY_DN22719_c0_g1_i1:80-3448(+)